MGNQSDNGIVQIFNGSEWQTVCGLNFEDPAAAIICRRKGFNDGKSLPLAAYGELSNFVAYPGVLQECPTGQEARLVDCVFDLNAECSTPTFTYASVKCFNVLQEPTGINLDLVYTYFISER